MLLKDKDIKRLKKIADTGLILGDRKPFKATVDKTTGFLTAPVKLARTGVQTYFGFELGLADRALDKIGVFRSPEEVFNQDSIDSFINLVVTDDHPEELVTSDNVKELQKGQVSQVAYGTGSDVLDGVITITDKDQIKKMKDGKAEVSVGYTNDLAKKSGIHDGVPYEFVQTNIRANHLAIVDAGRCGPACKITIDKKKENLVKITIDGIEYDTENKQLAQAIQKQQSAHDAEIENLKKKKKEEMDELEEEKKKETEAKDAALAAVDAAKKATLDADAINVLVSERAELLSTAKTILGDKMPECNDCPREIQAAVADAVLGVGDLSKKSEAYIQASYDLAIDQFKKAGNSLKNLANDFKKGDKKEVTRDSARKGYMKDTLGATE